MTMWCGFYMVVAAAACNPRALTTLELRAERPGATLVASRGGETHHPGYKSGSCVTGVWADGNSLTEATLQNYTECLEQCTKTADCLGVLWGLVLNVESIHFQCFLAGVGDDPVIIRYPCHKHKFNCASNVTFEALEMLAPTFQCWQREQVVWTTKCKAQLVMELILKYVQQGLATSVFAFKLALQHQACAPICVGFVIAVVFLAVCTALKTNRKHSATIVCDVQNTISDKMLEPDNHLDDIDNEEQLSKNVLTEDIVLRVFNYASVNDITCVWRVGLKTASQIVRHRRRYGELNTLNDLYKAGVAHNLVQRLMKEVAECDKIRLN